MMNGNGKGGFRLSDFRAEDETEIAILDFDGEPSGWFITLAGPAHARTIEIGEEAMRRNMRRLQSIEQAQAGGKRYTPPEPDPQTERAQTVESYVGRIIGWRGLIHDDGTEILYSPQEALKIFSDRHFDRVLAQIIEYIGDERSFMKRSAAI